MKITLINQDYMLYADPPINLAYLAAYARKYLPEVEINILDQFTIDEMINKLKKDKPKIIGISATCLNYFKTKELAKIIAKQFPDSLMILGGVYITTHKQSFNDSPFDLAIIGEGERTFLNLIKSVKKFGGINVKELRKIKGLMFRNGRHIIDTGMPDLIKNLDEVPLPARDLLRMDFYSLPGILSLNLDPSGTILTSRGCPFNCSFCSSSCMWYRKLRFFSAQRVVDEIELLYKKYGYKSISIYDDIFSVNKERLREVIKLMSKKKILGKITFFALARSNTFDEETARLLKKLGVLELSFGFESGSQKMLNYLKGKGIKLEDSIRAIKICRKYNISCHGFIMIGSPGEKVEDLEQTYYFIKDYCHNFSLYQTIAYPGTSIWEYVIKNKIIRDDHYEHKQKDFVDMDSGFLLSKEISKEEFVDYFKKIKSLQLSKSRLNLIRKLLSIKPRHIKKILSPIFIKKANILKRQFLKRIF